MSLLKEGMITVRLEVTMPVGKPSEIALKGNELLKAVNDLGWVAGDVSATVEYRGSAGDEEPTP
jgi:hypothetical protein